MIIISSLFPSTLLKKSSLRLLSSSLAVEDNCINIQHKQARILACIFIFSLLLLYSHFVGNKLMNDLHCTLTTRMYTTRVLMFLFFLDFGSCCEVVVVYSTMRSSAAFFLSCRQCTLRQRAVLRAY